MTKEKRMSAFTTFNPSLGRELTRGVMFAIHDATGRYPRPRSIWPTIVAIALYALMAISLIAFTAVQIVR